MNPDEVGRTDEMIGVRRFTRRQVSVGLGILGLGVVAGVTTRWPSTDQDQGADLALENLGFLSDTGATKTLSDFRGESLVVNFFAGWCPPCRAELPDFETVHLANVGQVKFLGISHDLDEGGWRALIDETGVTFETGFQPGSELWTALGAIGMPSTAFISPEGAVRELWSGFLTAESLQEMIDEHLLAASP